MGISEVSLLVNKSFSVGNSVCVIDNKSLVNDNLNTKIRQFESFVKPWTNNFLILGYLLYSLDDFVNASPRKLVRNWQFFLYAYRFLNFKIFLNKFGLGLLLIHFLIIGRVRSPGVATNFISNYFQNSLAFGFWVLYIVGVLDGHHGGKDEG
jgi:hypothetical protein